MMGVEVGGALSPSSLSLRAAAAASKVADVIGGGINISEVEGSARLVSGPCTSSTSSSSDSSSSSELSSH